MQELPPALKGMASFPQFLLFKKVWDEAKQKFNKIPISPHTWLAYEKGSDWQSDPTQTATFEQAAAALPNLGSDYGIGFLFTKNDPFYFLDIDNCVLPDGSNWTPTALTLIGLLPNAAIEVSTSGKGLHIIGSGVCPDHGCRNTPLGLEFYTEGRFVALSGDRAMGDCFTDNSAQLPYLIQQYFSNTTNRDTASWTTEAVEGWDGERDDQKLIERACATKSGGSVFGNKASFQDLWEANVDKLNAAFPDTFGNRSYDGSLADASLAQHLAFWTGGNCERIKDLMFQSDLVREKWDRDDYIEATILRAVANQTSFHGMKESHAVSESYGAGKIKATSEAQRAFAENVREQKLAMATPEQAEILCKPGGMANNAKFWLNNQELSPTELVAMTQPIASTSNFFKSEAEIVSGYQYVNATVLQDHFKGCVYVQDQHRILTPSGALLKSEQFNASYGGYVFQLDETGDKTTRKAWEAFTESQVVRFPKVETTCFRPELPAGHIFMEGGMYQVNSFVPVDVPMIAGDVTPFLTHLAKVLPDGNDQAILLSYMAACIQHKGVKFQWAPLLQGTEGNGKTLFTRCVAYAIGEKYTHLPPANDIAEKFNEWLFNKLFIGVEDIYVPEHKKEVIEVIKPMITNDRLAKRAMQQSQVMGDNRANFMLNSNHKDAYKKTRNDRRIAVFFTAQQTVDDLIRDGMGDQYFTDLYHWLRVDNGYAKVAHFLDQYSIPYELNPAGGCQRAPKTTSTFQAISESMGSIEQEIMEAIEEGRPGFAGGWVSSVALDRLLSNLRATRTIPQNKRRDLLQALGYDWHPALNNGRVNNPIPMDENKKSKLFIREGHLALNLTSASDVANAYVEAQTKAVTAAQASIGKQAFG